jgi:tellurite resistance-related uncharacterized protein
MPNTTPDPPNLYTQREQALSRWDNEGGAGPGGPQKSSKADETRADVPDLSNAELIQLRVRVIALENLVIALLAGASGNQLEIAREMATYISPRPGFTPHPMTVHAADHMVDLVDRAGRFRVSDEAVTTLPEGTDPYKRTPVFDETTLPAGLRREHRTKPGVWGVIRVLEGRVRYRLLDRESDTVLDPEHPGLVLPDQPHLVEPLGPMRMQIEFYDKLPEL